MWVMLWSKHCCTIGIKFISIKIKTRIKYGKSGVRNVLDRHFCIAQCCFDLLHNVALIKSTAQSLRALNGVVYTFELEINH